MKMWIIPILFVGFIALCYYFTEGGYFQKDCVIEESKNYKVMLLACTQQVDEQVKGNWTVDSFSDAYVYLVPD